MIKAGEVTEQFLNEAGINPFAVKLVAESFNKVAEATPKGVSFCFNGVRITLEKQSI